MLPAPRMPIWARGQNTVATAAFRMNILLLLLSVLLGLGLSRLGWLLGTCPRAT